MDDDFATMSTYEQLEYRTGQLEAQRQISKLLNVRAERAETERDALRAEVARLQEAARALYETFYVDDDGGAFVYWITKPKHVDKFIDAFNLKE